MKKQTKEQAIKLIAYAVLIIVNLFHTWWCLFTSTYPSFNLFWWWLGFIIASILIAFIIDEVEL